MVKTVSSLKKFKVKILEKRGVATTRLELRANPQDRDSCVIICLEEYLKRSSSWRKKGQCQLLLSHLKPNKEIQKSALTGWKKIVLRKADIDTSKDSLRPIHVDLQQLPKLRQWVFPVKGC